MPLSEARFSTLKENKIFLSALNLLNDPSESLLWFEEGQFNKNNVSEFHNTFRKMHYLASFTTDNTNQMMWSTYANRHQGVCFEYDLTENDDLSTYLRATSSYPVIYRNNKKNLGEYFERKLQNKYVNKNCPFETLLIKSEEWEYEKEWRLVVFEGIQEDEEMNSMINWQKIKCGGATKGITINMPKPSSVFFGSRSDQAEKNEILILEKMIKFCRDNKIKTFLMTDESQSYELKPVEF